MILNPSAENYIYVYDLKDKTNFSYFKKCRNKKYVNCMTSKRKCDLKKNFFHPMFLLLKGEKILKGENKKKGQRQVSGLSPIFLRHITYQ